MGLKLIRNTRTGIYQIHGTVEGIRVRQSAGTTDRTLAEKKRIWIERDIIEGSHGQRHHSFAEAVEGYLKDGRSDRFMLAVFEHFDGWQLRHITPSDIREAARKLYPRAANSTRNRQAITPAQAVVNWAHSQGWCAPIKVERFPTKKADKIAIGRNWLNSFMGAAPLRLGALYLFMHTTGARITEACRLEWPDVDLKAMTATLRDTKNGTDHIAHMTAEMAQLLTALPVGKRVFGYRSRHSVYGVAQNVCKRAGIPYVPPHQAGRHSFATALHDAGLSVPEIAEAGNWKSHRLLSETYVHPENAGKRAAEIMGKR